MTDLSGVTPANTNEMPTPNPEVDVVQDPTQNPEVGTEVKPEAEQPKSDEPVKPIGEIKVPDPEVKEGGKEEEFNETGNEFVDNLLVELKSNEVDVQRLFGDFLESGNEADIDRAYLEEKVGKLAAAGLIAGALAENAKLETAAEEASKLVYDTVGGEQVWDSIMEWIASGESGLTADGGQEYNRMLEAGGVQAQLAAQALVDMYKQSPGFEQQGNLITADKQAQPQGLQEISRAEYVEELDKAVRQYGEYSPQAEALHKRREFTLSRSA